MPLQACVLGTVAPCSAIWTMYSDGVDDTANGSTTFAGLVQLMVVPPRPRTPIERRSGACTVMVTVPAGNVRMGSAVPDTTSGEPATGAPSAFVTKTVAEF